MIREIIIPPIIIIIIITFMINLTGIAKDASAKVLNFSQDMTDALDCAFDGVSIYNCSPNLPSYDFEGDLVHLKKVNQDFIYEIREAMQNSTNTTVIIIYD